MKKVLVISPNFPPVNAADMHRIRQSLPYLKEFGWEATVIAVRPEFVEMNTDPMLEKTIPADAEVIRIPALDPKFTRKIGLGNLGYRALWYYFRTGTRLLRQHRYDLIFFTTTAFPVIVLGRYWKRKFGIPFIIDMQDPWRNDFYLDKPKHERPPKFMVAYTLDKWMEAHAMRKTDGIIAVSAGYPETLMKRYPNIKPGMCEVIPFGGAPVDFEILENAGLHNPLFSRDDNLIHLSYIGRGGHDMQLALSGIFSGIKLGLEREPGLFSRVRVYFIGTSYAADGKGKKTVEPVALLSGVEDHVTEITDRLPYFTALKVLKDSDILIIPGSTDTQYTASKLYPYILAARPILAVFNENSSVVEILSKTKAGICVTFRNEDSTEKIGSEFYHACTTMLHDLPRTPSTAWDAFEPYTAREATRKQVDFFNKILVQ